MMIDQHPSFTHTLLESKLRERLASALRFISTLSIEDVLRCDGGCLTELVREFAIAPPILRSDLMVADEKIIEIEDMTFDRKAGNTGHIFLIPVERDAEWLEEVNSQKTTIDDHPLAFLDRKRAQISIRLMLSPDDGEGTLKRKLDYRTSLVEQYVNSVATKLIAFNNELAQKMTAELNKRKNVIVKAKKEVERTGLPRVHNPEHEEKAIQIDRLLRSLGTYMTSRPSYNKEQGAREIRSFIVHGHDHHSLFELKDYIQNTLKLGEPVVLRQMPGLGKTLIEKFEREAEAVELIFVLLTPDDKAAALAAPNDEKRRARQNVILELGFFLGKLGRESGKVLLLHKGPTEIPSDIIGIEYIDITNGIESAGESIRRELEGLGILN
jgi:predicted nucleotide-binding protein